MSTFILNTVAQWLEADRELFEERAAIMEYDGGLSRPDAERCAYLAYVRETQTGQADLFAASSGGPV